MRRLWLKTGILIALICALALTTGEASAHPDQQSERPDLPDEQTYETTHFIIHYTLTGRDAISGTDDNGNRIPDYVEEVAETVEHVWTTEIDLMGWPPPASDGGRGGDDRLDVYLQEILDDGYAGYVDTDGGYIGDNPLTPEQERRAAYGFMVLDNDYDEIDREAGETPSALMRATVAHEFNHLLQAGIDDNDLHFWLYEATATWMEDEVYTEVNDGVYYLDAVFKSPDICLVAEVARGDDLHWYGEWLLMRMLSERYGSGIVLDIWQNMRQFSGFGAIDEALAPYGLDLVDATRDFAVANLLRAYTEGNLYPTVHIEDSISTGTFRPNNGVQSLGADYLLLTGSGPLQVALTDSDVTMNLRVVGVRGEEADVFAASGSVVTVNMDAYEDVYIIVHNDIRDADDRRCEFASYELEVSATGAATSPVASVWPANNYSAPLEAPVDSISGGEGSYRPPDEPYADSEGYSSIPDDLDLPFDIIVPLTPPPGYTFDYAYVMTEKDFGESAIYYVPGGGDSANFDYLDEYGNWLSIAESPSPYITIQEWMEDIGYTDPPGEIRTIADVLVLVEDLGDSSGPWYSATLILDNLFIVVDGDYREEDVIALVEALVMASENPPDFDGSPDSSVDDGSSSSHLETDPSEDAPIFNFDNVGDEDMSALISNFGIGICASGLCLVLVVVPIVAIFVRRRRRQ